jgi:fatty-acyl-CoA synthase
MPTPNAPPPANAPAHHRFWPRRLPFNLHPPATSLWCNLEVSALRYPDKPALVFFDRLTTYADLLAQAERLAAHLRTQGVQDGDRVIVFMQNCPQWIVAYYAVLRANAVVVPVNPMNKADELGHYITDPDARVAICAAAGTVALALANSPARSAAQMATRASGSVM